MTACTSCGKTPSIAAYDDVHLCAECLPHVPLPIDKPPKPLTPAWVPDRFVLKCEHERIVSELQARIEKLEDEQLTLNNTICELNAEADHQFAEIDIIANLALCPECGYRFEVEGNDGVAPM